MLPPTNMTPPLLGTPARVNPFSLRQDLNGGRCKLLDTPSKSVMSLTFTLPALQDPCAPPRHLIASPRRCQSLPCIPETGRTPTLSGDIEGKEEEEDISMPLREGGIGLEGDDKRKTEKVDERLHETETENSKLLQKENRLEHNSTLPVDLEMVTLEQLEEEEETVCLTEPMDCTKSPVDFTPGRPTSTFSFPLHNNGWRLPIFNGPPSLPPLPRLDINGLALSQQWGGGGLGNGYSGSHALSSDPGVLSEQDEVISCPGCCLVGLNFPTVCLRGSAAIPAQSRRASLLRSYRNLNGPITGGSASSSATTATATKAVLCHNTNGLVVAGLSLSCEPGRPLPEAQT